MEITKELTSKIIDAIKVRREVFTGSDARFAISLEINSAQYSRIINGDTDKVLSEAKWISLARLLEVNIRGGQNWKTALTPVYIHITKQLEKCQKKTISALLCDNSDIGKTYAAKAYAKNNKNAVYIDCSQVKSKQKLIRSIAKEYGVNYTGKYQDVFEDLKYYLNFIKTPLVILDEAGDLDYPAFLELKALWNACEDNCAWFMMGADGLKEKIRRAIDCKKVGYTEIFSRYGKRYQKITPEGKQDNEAFAIQQAALIIKANAPAEIDIQKLLKKTEGSLRRIYTEISKINY